MFLPPLADVVEVQLVAQDLHVRAADRREAVRRLRLRGFLITNPEESLIDEAHDRGEHALPIVALQVRAYAAPQLGQRLAELDDAAELLLFTLRAKARVIEILRAPFLVDADSLQRCRV